ncbi:MAG: hypothetical protein JJU20_14035 [Opitutales bacterium]|nr:hypothetical protein [Opitutales bacterium]
MITRRIGRLLRGKATPFHLFTATILGGLYAFYPGFQQAPLLGLLFPLLVILINANIFVFGVAMVLGQILHWILLPVQFHLGVWLIEGPLSGLFALIANAPITAWMGLEYYVVSSGLLFGLLFGLGAGWLFSSRLQKFRKKMGQLEQGSEKYNKLMARRSVKILGWILFGGTKALADWNKLTEKRIGNPLRPLGLILVAAALTLVIIAGMFFDSAIINAAARDQLTRINGATVDVGKVDFAPFRGHLKIASLALADPEELDYNRFSSGKIEASFSIQDLLRRRFAIESLQVHEPRSGTERRVAGRLHERPDPDSEELPEELEEGVENFELLDWIEDARVWRDRLRLAHRLYREWGPRLRSETDPEEERIGWRDRLAERAAATGYARVQSPNLIRTAPRFMIHEAQALDFRVRGQDALRFHFSGWNLASEPHLTEEPGRLWLRSDAEDLSVDLRLHPDGESVLPMLQLKQTGISVEELRASMSDPNRFPIQSGTIDIHADGEFDPDSLRLPVTVTLRDARIEAFGQDVRVSNLEIPATLTGSLSSPKIRLHTDAWEQAIRDAAGGELRQRATDELRRRLPF